MTIHHVNELTAYEIEILLDVIEAQELLAELIEQDIRPVFGMKAMELHKQAVAGMWEYVKRTGRAINAKVGHYGANVWD